MKVSRKARRTAPMTMGLVNSTLEALTRDRARRRGNARMRRTSGNVKSRDPLVAFLYTLARDYMPPGMVEQIMLQHVEGKPREALYTNGWLARWAIDVARRLRPRRPR